jgi:hypothetical protein
MQLAELLLLTDQHIALAFRVPLQILGLGSAPLGSTEALMSFWLASGLGFALNHIEQAFDKLFGLAGEPTDFTEFDTSALLRGAQKDRIDALVRGVQGGIYSPNEARNQEGLDSVEYGEQPRLQAQVVPLSAAASVSGVPTAPAAPATELELTKSHQALVARERDAMVLRMKRGSAPRRANGSSRPVVTK